MIQSVKAFNITGLKMKITDFFVAVFKRTLHAIAIF